MAKLILINGQGGVGKSTTARHLLKMLPSGAYIPTDSLVSVQPFEWSEEMLSLGVRNAHLLIKSFTDAGYEAIILCGLLANQAILDHFIKGLMPSHRPLYVWLRAEKIVRDERRISRARDDADQPKHFDFLDQLIPDLNAPLFVQGGAFIDIDTSTLTPDKVAEHIRQNLAAVKGNQ